MFRDDGEAPENLPPGRGARKQSPVVLVKEITTATLVRREVRASGRGTRARNNFIGNCKPLALGFLLFSTFLGRFSDFLRVSVGVEARKMFRPGVHTLGNAPAPLV